jgi:hypothetical protein
MDANEDLPRRRGRPRKGAARRTRCWDIGFDAVEAAQIEDKAALVGIRPTDMIRSLALYGKITTKGRRMTPAEWARVVELEATILRIADRVRVDMESLAANPQAKTSITSLRDEIWAVRNDLFAILEQLK